MTIVAIHPGAELYGSDRMFLASLVAARQAEASVLAVLPGEGPLAAVLSSHGVEVLVEPYPVLRRAELSGLRALPALARWAGALPRCVRLLRRHRPEVVYVSTVVSPIWLLAARITRHRSIVHVHENEPDLRPAAARLLLAPLRLATTVVANSETTRSWVVATVPQVAARTVVVVNGVAGPAEPAPRPPPTARPGVARLVVVGRLSERKGQDVAVRAAHLLGERGFAVDLALAGSSFPGYEDYAAQLEALAAQSGPNVSVRFLGFVGEPSHELAAADVALVPSTRPESFGNVAVEALLAGVPTVVTDVPGLRDVLRHRETGMVVPPSRPDLLADAIEELITDPTRAAALATAGAEDARRRFGLARYEAAMAELLCPTTDPPSPQWSARTRRDRRRPSSD